MRHGLALRLLGQDFFRAFAFRQIATHTLDTDRFALAIYKSRTDFKPYPTTTLRNDLQLINRRNLLISLLGDHLSGKGQELGRQHVHNIHLQRFLPAIARDLLATSIQRRKVSREVVRIDDVVGVLKEFPVALLVFLQCLLRFTVLRYISSDANYTDYLIRLIGQRRIARFERKIPNVDGARKCFARERATNVCEYRWIVSVDIENRVPDHFTRLPTQRLQSFPFGQRKDAILIKRKKYQRSTTNDCA